MRGRCCGPTAPPPTKPAAKTALQNLLDALAELERKVARHDAAGWTENGRSSIAIGALRPSMAALAAYREAVTP